jgi:hypothetical protein
MKKRLDKRVASLEGNNLAVQWNLSNPTPEFSDKNLWSQSISVTEILCDHKFLSENSGVGLLKFHCTAKLFPSREATLLSSLFFIVEGAALLCEDFDIDHFQYLTAITRHIHDIA